jgi:hypothetical protein
MMILEKRNSGDYISENNANGLADAGGTGQHRKKSGEGLNAGGEMYEKNCPAISDSVCIVQI